MSGEVNEEDIANMSKKSLNRTIKKPATHADAYKCNICGNISASGPDMKIHLKTIEKRATV